MKCSTWTISRCELLAAPTRWSKPHNVRICEWYEILFTQTGIWNHSSSSQQPLEHLSARALDSARLRLNPHSQADSSDSFPGDQNPSFHENRTETRSFILAHSRMNQLFQQHSDKADHLFHVPVRNFHQQRFLLETVCRQHSVALFLSEKNSNK